MLISGNHYYWTDTSQRIIWRAQLDGTQAVAIANLVTPGIHIIIIVISVHNYVSVDDLSFDWASNKLYWTDFEAQNINIFDLTSGYRANIIQIGSGTNPRGIVLDPQHRYNTSA